ncbi:MAG: hypothetical protein JNK05_28985 [Myxococcales bacterium]|nr:hypothetical protein [Myxococcales bacterium]
MRSTLTHAFAALALSTFVAACGNAVTAPMDTGVSSDDASCFPPPSCDGPQRCTGMLTYEVVESRPCAEACGSRPCVGSTCVAVSSERMCPAGMRCVAYRINDPRGFSSPTPCMPTTGADGG